jgi:hypothetical protein
LGHHLRQPNGGLDGLDLTEERANAAELMMAPMLQQARSLWCDAPVVRVLQRPPLVNLGANRVDDGGVVLLRLCGQCVVEEKGRLLGAPFLFGLGDRRDESAGRRFSMICWVGCPFLSSSQ